MAGLNYNNIIHNISVTVETIEHDVKWDYKYNYISLEMFNIISWYFNIIVFPVIAIIGLAGNVIGLVVLIKSGLKQPSNILLFCLTLADILCLINSVNIPYLTSHKIYSGRWEASYVEVCILAGLYMIATVLLEIGSRMSTYVTVWITLERILATFLPLRFTSLVTPTRAWVAGLSTFLLWCPWIIYINVRENIFTYGVISDNMGGIFSVGVLKHDIVYQIIRLKVVIYFTHTVPFAFVTIGCVIISVKLAITRRKRKTLISSSMNAEKSSKRTTKTLLMVCLFFSLTKVTFLLNNINEFLNYKNRSYTIYAVFLLVREALVYVHSASNCIIYIFFNNKFRKIFIHLFVAGHAHVLD